MDTQTQTVTVGNPTPEVAEVEKKYFARYTKHDIEVILFHLLVSFLVAGLLAVINEVTKLNFGIWTPYVILLTNPIAETIRRWAY